MTEVEYQTISVPFGTRITVEFPDDVDHEDDEPRLQSLSWVAGPTETVHLSDDG